MTVTVGVDLAADPRNTALVAVEWGAASAAVSHLQAPVDDATLVAALLDLAAGDRAGVDVPFGWPAAFVRAVNAHAHGRPWPGRGEEPLGFRRSLRLRRTDEAVVAAGLGTPLSVSTDRIGIPAMRWALVADAMAARGRPVARDGSGPVAEVYPAAARRRWGLAGPRDVAALERAAPYLVVPPALRARLASNEHGYDALVAALVARAVALGETAPPPDADRAAARAEGWIHVPDAGSLAALAHPAASTGQNRT